MSPTPPPTILYGVMRLEALEKAWDQAIRDDPLWSVLLQSGKRRNRWDLDDFLETGVAEVNGIIADLARLGIEPPHQRATS